MALEWTTAAWFLPFILPIAIWVSWSDLAHMKIPNKAVIAMLAVFALVGLVALPFEEYLWRYAHILVVFVIVFAMSSLGMMGAGDAKFALAAAPFIDFQDARVLMFLLGATTLAGFIMHRAMGRIPSLRGMVPDWESWTRTKHFPMGFALAPTLVFYLLLGLING